MTWTAVSDTTNPNYGSVGAVTSPAFVWGQLTPVTDQGDVDFAYTARDQFPMLVSSETARALPALTSVISEP